MKNLLFLFCALIGFSINAQITVQETPKDSVLWQPSKLITLPKIRVGFIDSTSYYTIFYRNAKYTHITDVKYINTGELESTISFYETCLLVINNDKEYVVTLPNETVYLSKSVGTVLLWTDRGYFNLTKKQLESILTALKQ